VEGKKIGAKPVPLKQGNLSVSDGKTLGRRGGGSSRVPRRFDFSRAGNFGKKGEVGGKGQDRLEKRRVKCLTW